MFLKFGIKIGFTLPITLKIQDYETIFTFIRPSFGTRIL